MGTVCFASQFEGRRPDPPRPGDPVVVLRERGLFQGVVSAAPPGSDRVLVVSRGAAVVVERRFVLALNPLEEPA